MEFYTWTAAAAAQLVLDGDGDGVKEWPRRKKPAWEKTREGGGSGVRKAAYFYAQVRSIWQLLEDGELGWETIRDYFFDFSQKIKDGEEK